MGLQLLPKVIGRVVLSGIQYQQVQVDGFRNHLVFIESLVKDLEKAQKEKHKAIEEKAKASVNSSSHRSSIKIFGKGIEELVWCELFLGIVIIFH